MVETSPIGISSPGATPVTQMAKFAFTANFGAIAALTGTVVTQNVPGLAVGDVVQVNCISAPVLGMVIANARVVSANTLEILITTAVAIGVTLGSLNYAGTACR